MTIEEIIGLHVKYYDFLGLERFGNIVFAEPTTDPEVAYVYIEDEDPVENNKTLNFVDGRIIFYAEIRLSTEIARDER